MFCSFMMAMLEMSLREFGTSNKVDLNNILKKDIRYLMGMLNRRDPGSIKNIYGERKKCRTQQTAGTAKRLMRVLHDRLLKHKWGDAAMLCIAITGYLWRGVKGSPNQLDISEVFWRMGNHLYVFHPTDRTQTLLANKQIYSFARLNQTQLLLEYAFSEMARGHIEQARNELRLFESIPRHAFREPAKTIRKQAIKQLKPLVSGYLAMMDYVKWLERIVDDGSLEAEEEEQLVETAKQILEGFRRIIFTSGNCWDIFLNKLTSILSYYELTDDSEDGLIADLSKYSQTHTSNPNAHLYLWQALKKKKKPEDDVEKRIECLRRLQAVDPSNKSCLDLHALLRDRWQKSGDVRLGTEAYDVIMSMLDYPCWREEEEIWGVVQSSLKADRKRLDGGDFDELVNECWVESGRSAWWPAYHFASRPNQDYQYLSPAKCSVYKILNDLL